MAEENEAPLSPEERAARVRLAKERALAARAARESGGAPPPAVAASNASVAVPATAPPLAETAAPAVAASPADRAAAIEAAKERAAAARAAREGGATPPQVPPAAAAADLAATMAEPAAPPPKAAAPASPAERAAAIQAAKERAAAARATRDGGGAPAPAAPEAKPAMSAEERAAAVAQAQERAAALKVQRGAAGAAVAGAPAAPAQAVPTWRIAPGRSNGQILTAHPESRIQVQTIEQADANARILIRRRQFLRNGFWAGFGVLMAGAVASLADFINPRDVKGFGGVVTIPAANVPKPGAVPYHYLEGKAWVANLEAGEGVIGGIGQPGPAGVLALYHKCPHLGCTVPWNPTWQYGNHTGWFKCPCHGSTYSKAGYRVFGPAPHSMWTFPVKVVKGGNLSVDTGKVSNGNLTQATTAVPYP